jgi:hypothetical protein
LPVGIGEKGGPLSTQYRQRRRKIDRAGSWVYERCGHVQPQHARQMDQGRHIEE